MKSTLAILPFAIFSIGGAGLFTRLLINHIMFWSYFGRAKTAIKSHSESSVNADYLADPLSLQLIANINNTVSERKDIFDGVFRAEYNRRYEIWIKSFRDYFVGVFFLAVAFVFTAYLIHLL